MVKVTTSSSATDGCVIRIDGALVAAAIPGLQRALAVPRPDNPTAIDLSGVTSIDPVARAFLLNTRGQGVRFLGASLYITQLLSESST